MSLKNLVNLVTSKNEASLRILGTYLIPDKVDKVFINTEFTSNFIAFTCDKVEKVFINTEFT